jgi:hypothetical protein
MLDNFSKNLTDITYPTIDQIKKERWDIEGRIHGSNQIFKFDVRPMKSLGNKLEKTGYLGTKANKIVFETEKKWVIFDIEELHEYIKKNNLKDILFEDLIKQLNWNIVLTKN